MKKTSKLEDSGEGTVTAMFDVSDILRKSGVARSHFQYSGSLTTPSMKCLLDILNQAFYHRHRKKLKLKEKTEGNKN